MADPSPAADRNLLFGILALQMDFVSCEALLQGMNAWVLQKDTPLGHVLQKHGALGEAEHGLVEAVVQRHLERHGHDAHESLAAFSSVGSVRQELARIADADVQASLARVAVPTPTEANRWHTGATTVGVPTSAGQRFQILRPHARGGLGEVFVARDEELHREVALKHIQGGHADDPGSRARFVLEAEITGGLEHPGIVPVYGLGCYPDGRPYYAMRFIKGDSLKEAIDDFHRAERPGRDPGERALAFRALLRRFVDVCNGVAYAHSRGVIHRDLKPANVMLGPYGETLVVDWGLAKVIGKSGEPPASATGGPEPTLRLRPGSGTDETVPGSVVGTPAFMSPEQAAGRLEAVGPASDVYSLGATLYVLLTGKAAFAGETAEILRRVLRGDFMQPRQAKRDVPPALEAVCLRAMALRPMERYGRALDLAADIEHWLADEPVAAYPEPAAVRARRWLRRHRAWVTGGVAALAVAAVLLGVLAWVLEDKNQELVEANERERQQRELADKQRQKAERNEKSAAEQRGLALQTIRRVVDQIHARLKDRPGLAELRKELLRTALDGLRKVARRADTAQSIDDATVGAHLEMGDIFLEYWGLGEAQRQYRLAHEAVRQMAAADPQSAQAQRDLAVSYIKLGEVSQLLGKTEAALEHYRDGLAIAKRLAVADPQSAQAQRDLYVSYIMLGEVSLQLRKTEAALRYYRDGLAIAKRLAVADPQSAQAQRDLAISCNQLGYVSLELGKRRAALGYYRDGLAIRKRLAHAYPQSAKAQRDLSLSIDSMGDVSRQLGKAEAALGYYRAGLAIRKRLAAADPQSAQAQRDLSITYKRLGDVSRQLGKAEAALGYYRDGLAIAKRLAVADRQSAEAQRDLSISYNKLGDLSLVLGKAEVALGYYRDGLAIRKRLAAADSQSARAQRELSVSYERLGDVSLRLGNAEAARGYYQEVLAIRKRLVAADPKNLEAQTDLLISYFQLGSLCRQTHQYGRARHWFARALQVVEPLDRHGKLKGTRFARAGDDVKHQIAFCQAAEKAVADLDFALRQPPPLVSQFLVLRAGALCDRGHHAAAAATADKLAGLDAGNGPTLYGAACGYSLCVAAVAHGRQSEQISAADRALQEGYAARAVQLLRQARQAGLFKARPNVALLGKDPGFDSLRPRPDFQALLAELAK
jgi:serine/threonine-protein kinase